jgi:hypothetical protein
MSGEMESDGDGEKGKWQDDGREVEGGRSVDKWKWKERDGGKYGGQNRNESRL